MVTGAGVYSTFQAIGCGISSSRQMRSSLEADMVVRISSVFSLVGWILAVVSIGRTKADFQREIEPLMMGFTASGILTIIFLILSTIQFNQWLTSFGVFSATISFFFLGGTLISAVTQMNGCTFASDCSYHNPMILSGGLIYLLGSVAGLIAKMVACESSEDMESRIISQIQVENYHDNPVDELDPKGIMEALVPTNEEEIIFRFLTTNPTRWNIWKGFAAIALICWIVFLSGFGALTDGFVPADFSAAAILYSLFGPMSIFALSWALIRNSRNIMSFAIFFCIIASISCGRLICVLWLNPFSSQLCMVIGCSGFIVSIMVLLSLIFVRFGVQFKEDGLMSRSKILFILSIVGTLLGTILITIGVLVRSDSKDLQFVRLSFADSIASFIVEYLSVMALFSLFYLANNNRNETKDSFGDNYSITSVSLVILIFGSFINTGSMFFSSFTLSNKCLTGSCHSGSSSNLLILFGSFLFIIGCFLAFWTIVVYGVSIQMDQLIVSVESDKELATDRKIDLYSMVMSWPSMQHWLKSCINIYIWSYFIFIVSLSYLLGKEGLNTYYSATLSFIALGLIAIFMLIFWIFKGNTTAQYVGIPILFYNSGINAFAVCWTLFGEHLGFNTPVILGSMLNILASSFILTGYMSWFSFRKRPLAVSSNSRNLQIISLAGWILFVIGFILHFNVEFITTPEIISNWIFLIFGFILFGFYVMIAWGDTSLPRKIGYVWLGITLSFGVSSFIFGIILLSSRGSQSSFILKFFGSLLFIVSSIGFILHKSYYGRINLSEAEYDSLLWRNIMSPAERPLHWIRQTSFSKFLIIYFVGIIITLSGIFALCASFIVLKLNGNLAFSHSVLISSAVSVISHLAFTFLRWESFGWSFIFSLMMGLSTIGPAVASILASSAVSGSNAGAYGIVAGCVLSLLGQILTFFVLISRSKISEKRWFLIIIKALIFVLACAWLLAIVALVVGTKLTASYLVISFPGAFSIIYLIFVYFWRPKVPKAKSLAEWLGYTIVKKSDLRDALKKANEEHIEVNNIAEDSELSKNPIFGKFKPKKKSVPLIERRTINESFDVLFGSQSVSIALALFSAFIYGIVAYDSIHYSTSKNTTAGYIYALSGLSGLLCYNIYILIVGITAFIDESRLKDSSLKSEEHLQEQELQLQPSILKSQDDSVSVDDQKENPQEYSNQQSISPTENKKKNSENHSSNVNPNFDTNPGTTQAKREVNIVPSEQPAGIMRTVSLAKFEECDIIQTKSISADQVNSQIKSTESNKITYLPDKIPKTIDAEESNDQVTKRSIRWIRDPDDAVVDIEDV